MFPRANRLRKSEDVLTALRKGDRRNAGPVACSLLRRNGTLTRVTVIAGTKVSKRAVVRNLLKRRARAIAASQPLPQGDLVIQLRPGSEQLDFPQLKQQLTTCLTHVSTSRSR